MKITKYFISTLRSEGALEQVITDVEKKEMHF